MQKKIKLSIAAVAAAAGAALVGWLAMGSTAHRPEETPASAQTGTTVVSEPLPTRPSQALVQMVEAAALGQASPFLKELAGQLPAGAVLVAGADEVDAGAEAGHTVPVSVWVSGPERVAGLVGTARFEAAGGGFRVRELDLKLIPLKVESWGQAHTAARRLAAGARRGDSPFYGRFRFTDGARLLAVDALSGAVEEE